VSGGVVIVAVLLVGLLVWSNLDEKQKKLHGTQPSGVKASPVTQLCADSLHNKCPGRVQMDDSTTTRCGCTCHQAAQSSHCGDQGRHDLCLGTVDLGSGQTRDCGCTCHARTSRTARRLDRT
jgi:hypothetical protein